jgi:hypothetical protein
MAWFDMGSSLGSYTPKSYGGLRLPRSARAVVPDDDEGETTTNGVESKRVGLGWDGKGTGGV